MADEPSNSADGQATPAPAVDPGTDKPAPPNETRRRRARKAPQIDGGEKSTEEAQGDLEQRRFYASIYPGSGTPIPDDLANKLHALEVAMEMPVWVLTQSGEPEDPFGLLGPVPRKRFFEARGELQDSKRVALVIDSLGGFAREAYQVATMLQRHCGGFVAVVPRIAKSAATLLLLGADALYMGRDAELGPLDVQIFDPESEETSSALDEVQAIERLNGVALDQLDQTMSMLSIRTGKKTSTLLPLALEFTASMMNPVLEQIKTVHYAKQSRLLKVAEEYALRLLRPAYGPERALDIARHLVNDYTEHGFVIDREEVDTFLDISEETQAQSRAIADLEEYLTANQTTVIGKVTENGGESE